MSMILVALAALQAAAPAAPAARTLQSLPNVTVKYYDVTGKDMKAINKSIQKQRSKDPATGKVNTAGTNWNFSPSFRRTTTNGVCKITEVITEFSGQADIPRLANPTSVPPAVAADWQRFQKGLENDAAARLWFVYDRIGGLKQAMIGKDCDQAVKEGALFLEKLKADASAYQPPQQPQAATVGNPAASVESND